LVSPL
jgi:hypothetical protein